MHTSFRVGDTIVMASDGDCEGQPSFQGFSLSLTAADTAEAQRVFAALAEGGSEAARTALKLAQSPNQFLSTVQIGITLVGILAGLVPAIRSVRRPIADGLRLVA